MKLPHAQKDYMMFKIKRLIEIPIILAVSVALSSTAFAASTTNGGKTPNGKPFVEINGQIAEVIADLDDHIADYDAIVARIDALELDFQGQIDAINAEIVIMNAAAQVLRDDIAATSDLATQNGVDIAGLSTRLGEIEGEIDTLQNDTGDNASAIAALEAEDLAIRTEIAASADGLLATVDNLLTNYATADMLNVAVQDLQNQIDNKQDDITGTCGSGAIRTVNDNGTVQCNYYNDAGDLVNYTAYSPYLDLDRTSVYHDHTYSCGIFGSSTCGYTETHVTSYGDRSYTLNCASGYTASGGGFYYWGGNNRSVDVRNSRPNGNGWYIYFDQTATSNTSGHYGYVYAQCLKVN